MNEVQEARLKLLLLYIDKPFKYIFINIAGGPTFGLQVPVGAVVVYTEYSYGLN